MRIVVTANVPGDAYIQRDHEIEVDGVRFNFVRGSDGKLERVEASTQVGSDVIKTSFGPGTDTDFQLTVSGGEDVHGRLVAAVQRLHAHLGFSAQGSIEGVNWREAGIRFEPENDQERANLKLFSASAHRAWPKQRAGLGEPLLESCARITGTHDHTFVAKSFWLEAYRCFIEQRYIQAFYNFYFVIEACFAGGKFREAEVVPRFESAPELAAAITNAFAGLSKFPEHQQRLATLCDEERLDLDAKSIPALLFRVRGRLHHYSERSPRTQPTPFADEEFQSIAWFSMGIATQVILALDMNVAPTYVAHTTDIRQ